MGINETILEINCTAAQYFRDCLSGPKGTKAVDFLKDREISPAIIEKFGIGFAPDYRDTLCDVMKDKGYARMELVKAGLAVREKMGDKFYDKFRNRVMFPISDVNGGVIAFTGRRIDDEGAVWLNSVDTPVFHKDRDVFALSLARQAKTERLILVEGVMDVIALHQAGFEEAVSVLGVTLTEEHAKLMASCAKNVVIVYDSDILGKSTSEAAVQILKNAGITVKVICLEGARDPQEFLRKRGATAFSSLIDNDKH